MCRKILYIFDDVNPMTGGGGAERVKKTALALQELGSSVSILSLDDKRRHVDFAIVDGIEHIILPTFWFSARIPFVSPFKFFRLISRFDVVHIHGHWSILNYISFLNLISQKKPYLYSPMGCLEIFGRSANIKKLYNILGGCFIPRMAHGCIAITNREAALLESQNVSRKAIFLVPNGIDVPQPTTGNSRELTRFGGIGAERTVLFVGRLDYIKGVDILIDAFVLVNKEFPDHILHIVGPDNGIRACLEKQVQDLGLSSCVKFSGFVGGKAKAACYAQADLLVVPSRREAMSIVALEAGALKTPVVISDVCDFSEVEAVHGGMVATPTAPDIARCICFMLRDPVNLESMGNNLYNLVRSRYTWAATGEKLEEVFSSCGLKE